MSRSRVLGLWAVLLWRGGHAFPTTSRTQRRYLSKLAATSTVNGSPSRSKEQRRDPNAYITRGELDEILRQYAAATPVKPTTQSSRGTVAFPQLSVLSYKNIQWGSTVCASFAGMLLAMSILPELWLLGALSAGYYGHQLTNDLASKPPTGVIGTTLVSMGRKVAKVVLRAYDGVMGVVFLFKTGQLSYQYYKVYDKWDQRFGIQEKMYAWNTRFAEGKARMDQWERENEVGRKALAMMRTFWLVEGKRSRRSRYRVVQVLYDAAYWLGRFVQTCWRTITGRETSELKEFLRGLQINVSETKLSEFGTRIGAILSAVIMVNLIGSLYAIAPAVVIVAAAAVGILWPTWLVELTGRVGEYFSSVRAVGRGESLSIQAPKVRRKVDRSRYSHYVRQDGSKRYYRTGTNWVQETFGKKSKKETKPWYQFR